MAFAFARLGYTIIGNKRHEWGTYTNAGGDTGGDINLDHISTCESFIIQQTGTAVTTGAPVVNETFPAGSAITIVTDDGADGNYFAVGN